MFGNSHLILPNGKSSRICVLRSIEPPENRWMYVPADYLRVAGFVNVDTVDIDRRTYERQLSDVLNKKYDLIFNICDALVMDVKAGFEVCYYLNTKCIVPFVSPSIRDYNISREEMKKACLLNGIRTPKHAFVYNLSADRSKLDEMKFPLIVKHFNSSDSWDLTKESRVANKEELDVQLKRMIDRNHGALVEEFIEGREFTCLLADNADDLDNPIVYEPVEFLFLNEGDTFKYQFLKFDNYKAMTTARVSDPIVVLQIQKMCKEFFKILKFTSYARCDLRMNSAGQVFMLEINPIPCLFYPPGEEGSADLILLNTPGGHSAFIENIIKAAVRRHQLRSKGWRVEHWQASEYCCKSTRPLQQGDVIEEFEKNQAKLTHVDRLQKVAESASQVKNQSRFFLPVSREYVITSDNEIDQYKFLRPSENPNCWLDGLRIVARRDIADGEELSFDYNTLYGDSWKNLINLEQSKTDWLALSNKYAGHVSSFVKSKAFEK